MPLPPTGVLERLSDAERAAWVRWVAAMALAEALRQEEAERQQDERRTAPRKAG